MKQGFTLIELLVVVLIIGVLAAIALPQYQRAVIKTRMARLLPLGRSLQMAAMEASLQRGEDEIVLFTDLDVAFPAGWRVGPLEADPKEDGAACSSVFIMGGNNILLSWAYDENVSCPYPLISFVFRGEDAGRVFCYQMGKESKGMCPGGMDLRGSLLPCEEDPDCHTCKRWHCTENEDGGKSCSCEEWS